MRPLIIPFFIPHAGCPHTCLFCDQQLISGEQALLPTPEQVRATAQEWLARSPGRPAEVAFYGGSFTLLPQQTQEQLLDAVQPLLAEGAVQGIRLSTRPDALSAASLDFLALHQVRTIEVGVQSLDDEVLQRSGRGHTAQQALDAILRVAASGFQVGAQLLPGLPGDTVIKAMNSLQGVLAAGAEFLRIYPAVVLAGTGLAELYRQGSYAPPDLETGVGWCARLLQAAYQSERPVIRIGLQADDGLVAGLTILAGCWHPALGQLVQGKLFCDLALQLASQLDSADEVVVQCHPKRFSEVRGHGNCNLHHWRQSGLKVTDVLADPGLEWHQLRLKTIMQSMMGSVITTLHYKEYGYA